MFKFEVVKVFIVSLSKFLFFLTFFIICYPINATAEIIWSGDYETGNFRQWHLLSGDPQYHLVPLYGRPVRREDQGDKNHSNYYGDGTLLTLVTDKPELEIPGIVQAGPVRQGNYSAKFTVKSEAGGGTELDNKDCDPAGNLCYRRRSEVSMAQNLSTAYNGLPHMSERWMSVSHYVPSDWDSEKGTGWGPNVFQSKAKNESGSSPAIAIQLINNGWRVTHRFHETQTQPIGQVPWQHVCNYDSVRPKDNNDERDLRDDFPDINVSQMALAHVNKGGWTDWVIHVKFDERGPTNGGTGFLRVWKRAGSEPWIKILNIVPKIINVRGVDYERGVGYKVPPINDNAGYGVAAGMYMQKEMVWGLAANRVIYNDNIKVGSEKASFEMMSPDGSSPTIKLLNPPENLRIN